MRPVAIANALNRWRVAFAYERIEVVDEALPFSLYNYSGPIARESCLSGGAAPSRLHPLQR